MNIFITGGAGYIGSHVSMQLLNAGHDITIYDDHSLGFEENIDKRAVFIKGSTLDLKLLRNNREIKLSIQPEALPRIG